MTNSLNRILRYLALPICGGVVVAFAFGSVGLPTTIVNAKGVGVFFIAGAVLTMLLGWPLIALLEWRFHSYRLRYVFGGLVCALLTWIFIEGAFFSGAWEKIWTSSHFWSKRAPRGVPFFSLVGLGAGLAYTAIVALINRRFPQGDNRTKQDSISHTELRMLAAPLCGGFAAVVVFNGAQVAFGGSVQLSMLSVDFVKGAFWSIAIGWPMLAIFRKSISRSRWHNIGVSTLCAFLVWLITQNVISGNFWTELRGAESLWDIHAVRELLKFVLIGLAAGTLLFSIARQYET